MGIKLSKWHQELDRFKNIKTCYIIDGNIYDLQAYLVETEDGIRWDLLFLDQYLNNYLKKSGYECVVFYNPVDGFYNEFEPENIEYFKALADGRTPEIKQKERTQNRKLESYNVSMEKAAELIRSAMDNRNSPTAIILNLASRLLTSPENLSTEEMQVYLRMLLATLKPRQVKSNTHGIMNNLLFYIVDKTNDLPTWFYLDNPYVKLLHITKPDKYVRHHFIETQLRFFSGVNELSADDLEKNITRFVDLTEGFRNIDLNGLKTLCKREDIRLSEIQTAINLFKYGVKENPWEDIDFNKLDNAEELIRKRVKGQDVAVVEVLDILKRAVSGFSGLQHSSSNSKPKGILFFAGPTGTGKTEMAKTLAQLIFGDESACIRFDMSEYQQSHSDQKLLGAPPGYVGYESGGQLTNAVKERPFSVLLFDEIEKADKSILDKFLQILEDGRMTDGKGETVYFSDTLIIFTSNLGIYIEENGKKVPVVHPGMEYSEMRKTIIDQIKNYFVSSLGRPEIYNRIGDNFVVFDYISCEVAKLILDGQLKRIRDNINEVKSIDFDISEQAYSFIYTKVCANLENGGRGIGNIVEKCFVNPLARFLYENKKYGNCFIQIQNILEENGIATIQAEVK